MSTARTKKIIDISLTAFFCVCLVLFMLTFSIGLPIYGRFFYYLQIKPLKLEESTGWTFNQIKQAYDEVLNFCTLPNREFSSGILKFSEEGAAHFADCKVLFNLNLGVLISSAAVVLVLAVLNRLKIITLMQIRGHRAYFASAIAAVALPVIIILIVLIVGFDDAFAGFHAIFFPGKDNWIFNPYTDEIIQVMPEEFFANCAIIIAAGLIGFAAGFIAADFVLYRRAHGKKTRLATFYILIAFIVIEGAIYCAFNVITLGFDQNTDLVKYFAIIICFLVAVLNCLYNRNKDCLFVAASLFFTVIADLFLLAIDDYYAAGIASFIVVQCITFARMYYFRKKIPIISGAVRLGIVAVILIVLGALGSLTAVSALSAIYFPQLVMNAVDSAFLIKKSKRFIFLLIGLILFIGCDACVGLDNFTEIGINIPAAALEIINPAIWLFYLPSQVFITLSADVKYKAALPAKPDANGTLTQNIQP